MRLGGLLFLSAIVCASPGDVLDEFEDCIAACEFKNCEAQISTLDNEYLRLEYPNPSRLLQLLQWDCQSECDYQCQQIVTQQRQTQGQEVLQFHGKWPFKRILNTQEFASTLFSMLNFLPHYHNMYKILDLYKKEQAHNFKVLYFNILIISLIAMGAWVSSTIFHLRDLLITERLDYFFAGATVLSGFHALLIRVLRLDLNDSRRKLVNWGCCLLYLFHFCRLNYDWSYTYNMQANVFIAVLQYALFLVLAYQHYSQPRTSSSKSLYLTPIFLIISVVFGMSFEIFDFINLTFQIDAHAIWHLTTIIPSYYLYDFFYNDINSLKNKYLD